MAADLTYPNKRLAAHTHTHKTRSLSLPLLPTLSYSLSLSFLKLITLCTNCNCNSQLQFNKSVESFSRKCPISKRQNEFFAIYHLVFFSLSLFVQQVRLYTYACVCVSYLLVLVVVQLVCCCSAAALVTGSLERHTHVLAIH